MPTTLDASTEGTDLTYDDWLRLDHQAGLRYELIDGELLVNGAPGRRHQRVSSGLTLSLEAHLRATSQGEHYAAPFAVKLSERDIVQPDHLVVLAPHLDRITDRGVDGAPDLVVEILSESTARVDEVRKRRLFQRAGVTEYWIVDPDAESIRVYRLGEAGTYALGAEFTHDRGDTLETPLLPGLRLELAAIFGDLPG